MKKSSLILFIILFLVPDLLPLSIVYNLRIAETTKRPTNVGNLNLNTKPSVATVTFFDQYRKMRDEASQNFMGGLGTLIYAPKKLCLKMDFAVGKASSNRLGTKFSRTQPDDVLFSAGYSFRINNKSNITPTVILGIPTHQDGSLNGVQIGTGHYGLGGQLDGSFIYHADLEKNHRNTLLAAVRLIHFFPRIANLCITNSLNPVLNNKNLNFKIWPGNLLDLFFGHNSKFGLQHTFEFGYNPSFLFNSEICPKLTSLNILERANQLDEEEVKVAIRNSFYGNYRYGFKIFNHFSGIGLGLSYGFDNLIGRLGSKSIITFWAAWGINF